MPVATSLMVVKQLSQEVFPSSLPKLVSGPLGSAAALGVFLPPSLAVRQLATKDTPPPPPPPIPAPSRVKLRNNEAAAYRKEIPERKKKQVLFKPQTLG